jgi:hypothetical protein
VNIPSPQKRKKTQLLISIISSLLVGFFCVFIFVLNLPNRQTLPPEGTNDVPVLLVNTTSFTATSTFISGTETATSVVNPPIQGSTSTATNSGNASGSDGAPPVNVAPATATAPTTNVISSCSFEAGESYDWHSDSHPGTVVSTGAYSGTNMLKLTGTTEYPMDVSTNRNLNMSGKISMSVYIKLADGEPDNIKVDFNAVDMQGDWVSGDRNTILKSGTWIKATANLQSNVNLSIIGFDIYFPNDGKVHTAYLDLIVVTAL